MYWWQVGGFMRDAEARDEFLPLLYQQFEATPSAQSAFFRLNEDLLSTVRDRIGKSKSGEVACIGHHKGLPPETLTEVGS
jgi:hypothetical protein